MTHCLQTRKLLSLQGERETILRFPAVSNPKSDYVQHKNKDPACMITTTPIPQLIDVDIDVNSKATSGHFWGHNKQKEIWGQVVD
jgi:hypothetical protein